MKNQMVCFLYMLIVVVGMVMLAGYFQQDEVIFPEAAAIATGMFLAPKKPWQVSYGRLIICIAICALVGWGIVVVLPFSIYVQMILAFVIGHFVLMFSGTTMTPIISAAVLPVLMQCENVVYPFSAVVIVAVIISLRIALVKSKIKEDETFGKIGHPTKKDWILFAVRVVVVSAGVVVALVSGMKFCVAPPLIVAFCELSNRESKAIERPVAVIFLVTGCALFGAAVRYLIAIRGGAPLYMAALATTCLMVMLMNMYKMYFPPAAAMGVLAMLIPEVAVSIYPLQVFIGISVFVLVALLINIMLDKRKSDKSNG